MDDGGLGDRIMDQGFIFEDWGQVIEDCEPMNEV